MNFDHEFLSKLYKEDKEEFDRYVNEYVNNYIDSITQDEDRRARMKAAFFNLRMKMKKYKDPLAAASVANSMLVDGLFKLNDAFKGNVTEPKKKEGKILPLNHR